MRRFHTKLEDSEYSEKGDQDLIEGETTDHKKNDDEDTDEDNSSGIKEECDSIVEDIVKGGKDLTLHVCVERENSRLAINIYFLTIQCT